MSEEFKRDSWIIPDPISGEVHIHPQKLYEYLKKTRIFRKSDAGKIYMYKKGVYRLINISDLKTMVKMMLPVDYRKPKHWNAVVEEFKTDLSNVKEEKFNSEHLINFENGILNLSTGELIKHSSEYYFTRQIPCNYVPNLTFDDAPVFKKYIEKLVDNDYETIGFLMEFIGATLSNIMGARFKSMLLLVGAGNTGKTQLRELVMRILGEENCISIDMAKINDRFGASTLVGKRLAGSGDMAYVELSEINIIKNLTGGDTQFAEYKGKDGFSFKYEGLLWFNANKLPYFRGDRGDHVYSRFKIVRCSNVIPENERDPEILDKMLLEKEAIINIAITCLIKAIKRGYKFRESKSMIAERQQYEIENNSLLTFVQECCDIGSGTTRRSEFNCIYEIWCRKNYVKPERNRDIGSQLLKIFGISSHKSYGHFVYNISINEDIKEELLNTDYFSRNSH